MSEELLNIAKELSEKSTTELALHFMELTADNITKDKEIERLNNIINELEKWIKHQPFLYIMKYKLEEKLKELKENNK